jgi:hypothetical protein
MVAGLTPYLVVNRSLVGVGRDDWKVCTGAAHGPIPPHPPPRAKPQLAGAGDHAEALADAPPSISGRTSDQM